MPRFYKYGFYVTLAVCAVQAYFLLHRKTELQPHESQPLPSPRFEEQTKQDPLPNTKATSPATADPQHETPSADQTKAQRLDPSLASEVRSLLKLRQHPAVTVRVRFLDYRKDELNPKAIDLLGIAEPEARIINALLGATQTKVLKERKQHSRTSIQEDGTVLIEIDPFLENGGRIRDSFYQELEAAIGSSKYEHLVNVMGEELDEKFKNFGAEVAEYRIVAEADESGQKTYTSTRKTKQENGYHSSTSHFSDLDRDSLGSRELRTLISEEALRHLLEADPSTSETNSP